MNDLKIFENPEFGKVRTVTINNEVYFVGKDVAEALGYERATKAIQDHVDSEDKDEIPIQDSIGRMQKTPVITESGLYALIFGSKLESAKRFKHWVTSEVLPSIRKTGSYQSPLTQQEMMRIQLGMIDEHEERIERLENNMNIDYAQQKQLREFVSEVVVNALGGRKSKAYHYQDENGVKLRPKVYSRIWHDFYDYFNINAYANLPRLKFDEALRYINAWQPPTNMQLEIGKINRKAA